MAEKVGFEPTEGVNPRRFSRPVHSTTLPLLRRPLITVTILILKVEIGEISPIISRRLFTWGRKR